MERKDQSYALWGLSQESLAYTVFPLGELTKPEVRRIAGDLELKTADKPESQDICFVPDDDYRRFLKDNFVEELKEVHRGEIIGPGGKILGHHDGIANFTVGQRKGHGYRRGIARSISREFDPVANQNFCWIRRRVHGERSTGTGCELGFDWHADGADPL